MRDGHHLLLVGNYLPDEQFSMIRYSQLLASQLNGLISGICLLRPDSWLGRLPVRSAWLKKWLGYGDKFVRFPSCLTRQVRHHRGSGHRLLVHICDHGNSLYTRWLQGVPHLVTCHDLLAVRCALGEISGQRVGWTGRRYQSMILRGLRRAHHVVCVSEHTRCELLRLQGSVPERVTAIYNGLNGPFGPMTQSKVEVLLQGLRVKSPYLLHVGGNSWYKNRLGVLMAYASLREFLACVPPLIMAGKPMTEELKACVTRRGLSDHVRWLEGCTDEMIRALYCGADALVFPSLAEGFGWPIIEAQACGCRVITTQEPPMTEVGGDAAVYCDGRKPDDIARAVASVLAESANERDERVALGKVNARRFSTKRMIEAYVALYERLLMHRPNREPNPLMCASFG